VRQEITVTAKAGTSTTTSTTVGASESTVASTMMVSSTTPRAFSREVVKAVAATSKEAAAVFAGTLLTSLEEEKTPTRAVLQAAEKTVEVRIKGSEGRCVCLRNVASKCGNGCGTH